MFQLLFLATNVFKYIGGFDVSLPQGAEDFELYLRLARKFPIHHHNQIIVEYRRHEKNMSSSAARQLKLTLQILKAQRQFIKGNKDEEQAYKLGKRHWEIIYGHWLPFEIVSHLKSGKLLSALEAILLALKHHPQGLIEYFLNKLKNSK